MVPVVSWWEAMRKHMQSKGICTVIDILQTCVRHEIQLSMQDDHEMTPGGRAGVKKMKLERRSLLARGQQGQKQRDKEHHGADQCPG